MTIDKSWISLRNRRCLEFLNGLNNFMEIARNHVNSEGKACCPCVRCANSDHLLQDLSTIYAHEHDRGFLQSYTTWVYHGEQYSYAPEVESLWAPNTHTQETNNEMFDVLEDVMAEQDTNEENEEEDEIEGTGLDTEFDALFNELNTELYPGSSYYSSEHWEGIKMGIHSECANRYKGRKASLKSHFDKVGGVDDVEEAKRNPPKKMLQETWVELIDKLFSTSKHANRCAKNKSNREKQCYGSYHGSQSLVNRRHKEVKETGHADYIKGWEEMHYKKGKWISEKASQDWVSKP
ncbi:hypothetical protein E3N88_00738 [Mikania micrantha]|uniref:Transposase-associated domain-containing protein n=1 Tax=Mikania micrantha TaxID=192012 RepID=A0A5N6PZ97_9ASTR|nr:hypothetical protein E3N88_00738 [Mikania micrantha]